MSYATFLENQSQNSAEVDQYGTLGYNQSKIKNVIMGMEDIVQRTWHFPYY